MLNLLPFQPNADTFHNIITIISIFSLSAAGREAGTEVSPFQILRDVRTSGHRGGEERHQGGLRPVPFRQEADQEEFIKRKCLDRLV